MKQIGIYEAKSKLSALIAELESGEASKIQLTKHGKVVAELVPPTQQTPRKRGCLVDPDFCIPENFDSQEIGFESLYQTSDPCREILLQEEPNTSPEKE